MCADSKNTALDIRLKRIANSPCKGVSGLPLGDWGAQSPDGEPGVARLAKRGLVRSTGGAANTGSYLARATYHSLGSCGAWKTRGIMLPAISLENTCPATEVAFEHGDVTSLTTHASQFLVSAMPNLAALRVGS